MRFSRLRLPLLFCTASALFASPAFSQFPARTHTGDDPGDQFGEDGSAVGDINGDGFDEYIIGAHKDDSMALDGGEATVYDGQSGAILYHHIGGDPSARFGDTVDGGGDLNNDGVPDYVVGAPWFNMVGPIQGKVVAFSGATGLELWTAAGPNATALFGEEIATRGDVNDDDFDDVLVGAPNDDGNAASSGILYIHDGATGNLLYQISGSNATDQLGFDVAYTGDVDGDGVDDFIAGAPFNDANGSNAGQATVFSGASTMPIHTMLGGAADDTFGRAVAALGDIDGDMRGDYAVAARGDDTVAADAGSVTVYTGIDGSVITTLFGTNGNDKFGNLITNAGDWDGDGFDDLGVVAPGAVSGGKLFIYSSATWTEIATVDGIAGEQMSDIAGGIDINGDSISEILIGRKNALGLTGESVIWSTVNLLGTPYCFGDGGGSSCPCGNSAGATEGCQNSTGGGGSMTGSGSTSVSLDNLELHASNLLPGQPALAFVALNATNGGNGVPFGDGLRCAGGSLVRLGIQVPDSNGDAVWGPGLAAQGGWTNGDVRRFQGWYRDPSGPCGTGFNLTNGFEVNFAL